MEHHGEDSNQRRSLSIANDHASLPIATPGRNTTATGRLRSASYRDGKVAALVIVCTLNSEKTEAELLLGFVKSLPVDSRGAGPILVTFGGNGFDLPLLRYRAFALGIPVPGLHGGGHRNYWHRFGSDHIDLCDVLSGYGSSTKPSLAEWRRWRIFR